MIISDFYNAAAYSIWKILFKDIEQFMCQGTTRNKIKNTQEDI